MSRGGNLRVAIVGAGLMGRWHGKAALRCGGRITAVVDPDERRGKALADDLGTSTVRTDLAGLLADVTPEVIHVCTPSDSHYPLALIGLEAGCHVVVEKPVALSHADTCALLDRAREQGLLLCPAHQFLYQRGALRLEARMPSLGALRHLQLTACSAGADGGDDRRRDEVAVEILPHFLALAARFVPGPLQAMQWSVIRTGPGELRVTGCGDAVTAAALVSLSGRPTRNELEWIGTDGTAYLDLYHGFATFDRGATGRRGKLVRPFRRGSAALTAAGGQLANRILRWEPAYPGLRELVQRFYRAVRNGGHSPISSDEVIAVSEVWERLRRSVEAPTERGC